MQPVIIYFIKANVVLSLLYGFYWLLLRNEKNFTVNRAILLACIAMALLLPFAPNTIGMFSGLQNTISKAPILTSVFNTPASLAGVGSQATNTTGNQVTQASPAAGVTMLQILVGIYMLVTIILLSNFSWQLFMLARLVKTNTLQKIDGINYLLHNKELPPFSFLNIIAINKSLYTTEECEQIIAHELVHIKQRHAADVLLAEIISIILWVNPMAYMLKRSIKLNLEYIADGEVLHTGIDRKEYQLNILNRSLNTAEYNLTNLFTSSKIKLRIKMMNTQNPNRRVWYKYAFVLPVLFAAYFVINPVNATPGPKVIAKPKGTDDKYKFEKLYVVINANTSKELLTTIMDKLLLLGVELKRTNEHFADGKLTDISVKFTIPGTFSGAVSSGSENGVLAKPIIFYYEPETGFHVTTGLVPDDLSTEGKKMVTNNLDGIMVIYKGGSDMSGSARWD